MVSFRNPSDTPVGVPGTEIFVRPGEIIGVPDGYALPRRRMNGEKRPSVINEVAPQLEPASEHDRMRVENEYAEDAVDRKNRLTPRAKEALIRMGISPAMAELMAAKDVQDLSARAKELTERLDRAEAEVKADAKKAPRGEDRMEFEAVAEALSDAAANKARKVVR